jgi:glycosyltransferase involved in cell wall biosynthesis
MNIAFVNYHHFKSNSAVHIFNLANELVAMGHGCAIIIPDTPESVASVGVPRFQCLTYAEAASGRLQFPDGQGPSLIHGWTPRESVREMVESLARNYGCPYFVHLEDNEELLTSSHLGTSWQKLTALSMGELDAMVTKAMSHPLRYRDFLDGAAGVSVIIDRLREFKSPEVPDLVLWPAFEDHLFTPQPPDLALRQKLRIPEGHSVIVYPGNSHAANATEMRSLYLAIGAVNRRGVATTLVRLGDDYVDFLGSELTDLRRHVIEAGRVDHQEIPRYLALADVLVQPGRADALNEYRFPSKLPEFFGMGKPVILPRSNIGYSVRDGIDGVLLREGSAIELAERLEALLKDPERRAALGTGARAFAEANLNWHKSATKLAAFYETSLAVYVPRPAIREPSKKAGSRHALAKRYDGFAPAELGYATVEDYSDSKEHLAQLASIAGDLKDVQRPWCVKAILGRVPQGSRLLEIGGGDPWVANLLTTLGYEVWLIDPYEGLGNGPTAFDSIRSQYPKVNFIRGWFPDALASLADRSFDAIYSISVLEHVPEAQLAAVASAIPLHIRDGGWSIHAVDHVTHGAGAAEHLTRLAIMARAFGFADAELQRELARLEQDPDAFFLSADGHNLWRGRTPYRDFPMRRCVSIQFCRQIGEADVRQMPSAAAQSAANPNITNVQELR